MELFEKYAGYWSFENVERISEDIATVGIYIFKYFTIPLAILFLLQKFGLRGAVNMYFRLLLWIVKAPFKLIRWFYDFLRRNRGKQKRIGKGRTLALKIGKIVVQNPFSGVLVCGGAGSGKSATIIEPIIKEAGRLEYAGILYDFKFPTLATRLKEAYAGKKIRLRYVNFQDLSKSHRINPISPTIIPTLSHAKEYAQALYVNMKPDKGRRIEPYWDTNAINIIAAVMYLLKNRYSQYCTLPHVIALLLSRRTSALLQLINEDLEASGLVATLNEASERGANELIANILSSLTNYISILNSKEVFWVLSGSDVTMDLNSKSDPIMLCLGNYPTLADTYSPLIGLIITVCGKMMNQPNKHQSIIILDEAPTVYIPKFESIPATARSNRVATVFAAQDIAQIADSYGHEKAEAILSNLGNQFYLRTTSSKTAERVSKLFGKIDKVIVNRSRNKGFSDSGTSSGRTVSYNMQERDVVKTQDVLNLPTGHYFTILSEGYKNKMMKIDGIINGFDKRQQDESLEPFVQVSENELKRNFEQIHKEARDILDIAG